MTTARKNSSQAKQAAPTVKIGDKDVPARLGLRPLARELGVAHTTLLSHEKNGHVLRGKDKKFDVAEVLAYRASITEDVRSRGAKAKAIASGDAVPEVGDSGVDGATPDGVVSIGVSKAKKEQWLAEQARIKAEKALGVLMERAVVENTLEAIGAEIVTGLRNLVPKLKPYMSDDGKKVLDKSIDSTLRDIGRKLQGVAEADHSDD